MNLERINHLNNAKKVGFEIEYKNKDYSKKKTVWINNIVSEYYSPYGIIQEIAEIILFQELFLEFNIPFKHWSELRQNWGKSIN